ncbi:MAG: hypothetical protein ACOH12_10010 [Parvibaculaceae bacterium]
MAAGFAFAGAAFAFAGVFTDALTGAFAFTGFLAGALAGAAFDFAAGLLALDFGLRRAFLLWGDVGCLKPVWRRIERDGRNINARWPLQAITTL